MYICIYKSKYVCGYYFPWQLTSRHFKFNKIIYISASYSTWPALTECR